MKTVRDIGVYQNVAIMVRAALNVPIENGKVTNTFRLRRAVPTIEYLRARGARVVLAGHLGEKGTETLMPVYEALKEFVPDLEFSPITVGPAVDERIRTLPPGGVLMLENLRRDRGEVMNSPVLAAALALLVDVFVEDSFDVCHRAHASVVGVAQLRPSFAGLLVEEEVRELSKALAPARPSLAVIGGAKFSTKEPVLTRLLQSYDRVAVGGALGNDFIQAAGYSVGTSLVSAADPKAIRALLSDRKLAPPLDAVVAPLGSARAAGHTVALDAIPSGGAVLDVGPKTAEFLAGLASGAKTVLWNGPLGFYENGFTDASEALARAIAKSGAHSIVGGGDTVAVVEALGLADRFSFISTGGGAMLDFLANGTLPGLQVLGPR